MLQPHFGNACLLHRSHMLLDVVREYLRKSTLFEDASEIERSLWVLQEFCAMVLVANTHTNLTSITTEPDFTHKHVLDSLSLLPHIEEADDIVDVGTGAGFPGIPIAAMRPHTQVTLIDTSRKRIDILRRAVEILGIDNAHPLHIDAKGFARSGARFSVCLARAVAPLPKLVDLCAPLLVPGGRLLAQKGADCACEIEAAAHVMKKRRLRLLTTHLTEITSGISRSILVFEKDV